MRTRATLPFLIIISYLTFPGCSRAPNPDQLRADSLLVQAFEKFTAGKYGDSRGTLASAITLQKELRRPAKLAEAQHLLGNLFAATAQFDSALLVYSHAMESYRAAGDKEKAHSLTLERANIHHRIGESRKAFAMYTEAIRLAKVFEDPVALRETEWAILPVCRALDNREEETRVLSELLNDATTSGSVRMQAKAAYEAGVSSFEHGEYARAEEGLFRALTLSDQARDSLLSISTLLKLAMTYTAQGRIPEAFQMYTDAITRSDATRGAEALREEMLIRVGNIYLRTGQSANARLFYRTALNSAISRNNKVAEGYLIVQLGHLAESPSDAMKNYQSALDLFGNYSYAQGSAYALFCLGRAAQRGNQLSEALNFFKASVEQHEASLLQRSADDLYLECETSASQYPQSLYDPVIELLLQTGRYDEAFWYMDRKKARKLYDNLSSLKVSTRTQDLTSELAQLAHAKALQRGAERQREHLMMTTPQQSEMLQQLNTNLSGYIQNSSALAERVVRANQAFELLAKVRNLSIAEIQKLLPAGEVLVTHFASARSAYCFAVSSSRATVQVAAVERSRAFSLVKEFAEQLRARESWKDSATTLTRKLDLRIEELSNLLYSILVRPIEQEIANASKLIIVQQDEFGSVPMGALRAGRAGSKYLVERYGISYLPSAAALLLKGTNPANKGASHDIVGVGHPGETSWDVEYELRDIRAFYKETRLYFGQQTVLNKLQSEHGDLLHLAVEIRCKDRAPGNITVSLSDGKAANTTKQVLLGDLFSLPSFPTAVLSDLGEPCVAAGSLIASIFLMNGTGTFATHSYIPARKTKKYFGEVFYTALLAGATPSSALRQVQLEMAKNPEYSSPHIWAPFVVWGN